MHRLVCHLETDQAENAEGHPVIDFANPSCCSRANDLPNDRRGGFDHVKDEASAQRFRDSGAAKSSTFAERSRKNIHGHTERKNNNGSRVHLNPRFDAILRPEESRMTPQSVQSRQSGLRPPTAPCASAQGC